MFGIDTRTLTKHASMDMTMIREWAGEIANSYLSSGVEPTHTLCKIAQSEDLTPHQVEVLAGEANKTIHSIKFASEAEKYHAANFPLADAKAAIASLQLDGGGVKTAAVTAEPEHFEVGPDPWEMFGVKPEVMDKTASVKHQASKLNEKLAFLIQKNNDRIIIKQTEKTAAERSFIKMARAMLLDQDSVAERYKVLSVLDSFVKLAGFDKSPLAKLAHLMMVEGKLDQRNGKACMDYFMSKEADCKAPEVLISDRLPGQVINGSHPLYITLKTLNDHEADLLRFEQDGTYYCDKARILGQKIRAL